MQSQQQAPQPDFLDIPEPSQAQTQAECEFAQIYYQVFVENVLGAKLLAQWDEAILRLPTAPNAALQQFAWDEGRRSFVRGIRGQIELARQARQAK